MTTDRGLSERRATLCRTTETYACERYFMSITPDRQTDRQTDTLMTMHRVK